MAILMYIDCTLIIDDIHNETVCLANRYQNTFFKQELAGMPTGMKTGTKTEYFLNYYSFMAKIDAPFVNKTATSW